MSSARGESEIQATSLMHYCTVVGATGYLQRPQGSGYMRDCWRSGAEDHIRGIMG
jgi:hypothetical protein